MQALSQLSYGPLTLSIEHDLVGKPVATFPDHAPARLGRLAGIVKP
jgi:hypothetical protein